MSPSRAALLLSLSLALPGCTKLFDTASLDPLATAEGFCRAEMDAHYQFTVRCEGWDPTHAVQRPEYWYVNECAPKGAAVAAGRMTYDRASGEACLAAYAIDACPGSGYGEPRNALAACRYAIASAVPEGGECVGSGDCLSPGWCASPDGTCPGHCIGFGLPGATCDPSAPCAAGLWCDGTSTCVTRKGSGAPCSSAAECMENLTCDGTSCSYVAGVGGSCAVLPCDSFLPLYCAVAGQTCLAIPSYNEPCGNGTLCEEGFYCDPANTRCYPKPTAPQVLGGYCGQGIACAAGLWCDETLANPICKLRKSLGASCANVEECLQPAMCDMSGAPLSWACRAARIAGQPCSPAAGRYCSNGAWCYVTSGTEGTCVSERDLGQPCGQIGIGDYASCSLDYCAKTDPADLVGTCRAEGGAGARCNEDAACQSYSCDLGTGTCRPSPCPLGY